MDIQDLRRALECANQQIHVLDTYLRELTQQCEQLAMDPTTDFTYLTFKLTIMAEVKKVYEHYRDLKQDEYQQQCTTELTEILHTIPVSPVPTQHEDTPPTSPTAWDIDIHHIPSLLAPIDDPVLPGDILDRQYSVMDFMSDMDTDHFRDI